MYIGVALRYLHATTSSYTSTTTTTAIQSISLSFIYTSSRDFNRNSIYSHKGRNHVAPYSSFFSPSTHTDFFPFLSVYLTERKSCSRIYRTYSSHFLPLVRQKIFPSRSHILLLHSIFIIVLPTTTTHPYYILSCKKLLVRPVQLTVK